MSQGFEVSSYKKVEQLKLFLWEGRDISWKHRMQNEENKG